MEISLVWPASPEAHPLVRVFENPCLEELKYFLSHLSRLFSRRRVRITRSNCPAQRDAKSHIWQTFCAYREEFAVVAQGKPRGRGVCWRRNTEE